MERQNYPIGEQNFKTLRELNQVYVDKTHFIPELLRNKYYFLSRPRRFGKSLFLSTLEQFFVGNRDIFKGLSVYDFNWNWQEYPIIRIDLSNGSFSLPDGLNERLNRIIDKLESRYDIITRGSSPGSRLDSAISLLNAKLGRKVVILIDEYEKPLLDTFEDEHHERYKKELRDFYSVLKENSSNIEFLFSTGVTRFGHLNIFSGLNNLLDISLEPKFSSICGITETEFTTILGPGIDNFATAEGCTYQDALDILKKYYDGYHFSKDLLDIYNPWSLMNCLYAERIKSEWFTSGSPSYLLKILRKKNYDISKILGTQVTEELLKGNGVDEMDPTALLYQSGYLTIKSYDRNLRLYSIGLPNFEVRTALWETIIPFYLGKDEKFDRKDILKLFTFIESGEAEKMMEWLAAYFSKISFDTKINYERDFQVIVLGIFLLIKDFSKVHCEYAMSSGRTDLVLESENYVYIFEFKMGENAEKALQQINSRGYDIPWKAEGRKVIKIGASFSTQNGGILNYKIEEN